MRGKPVCTGGPIEEYADVVECLWAFLHVGFFLASETDARRRKVQLLGGNDNLKLDNANFDRAVSIDAGSGNDLVQIEANGSNSGPASVFGAAVSVVMGSGIDGLQIGVKGQRGNHATFRGATKFNGGLQRDVLTYSDVRNLAAGSVAAFESINPVSLGINLRSARSFAIL